MLPAVEIKDKSDCGHEQLGRRERAPDAADAEKLRQQESHRQMCAGRGRSVEVKYVEITTLKPANGQAMKYSRRPSVAMLCSMAFCSLLKMAAICPAPKNTTA